MATGKEKPKARKLTYGGKTEGQLAKEAKVAGAKKGAAKGAGADAAAKIAQDITNRYRVTAREARDIVTAVSTAASAARMAAKGLGTERAKVAVKDIPVQVKEAAKAAVTGKKGTTPMTEKAGYARKGQTGFSAPDVSTTKGKRK